MSDRTPMQAYSGNEFLAFHFKGAAATETHLASLLAPLARYVDGAPREVWQHWMSPRGTLALVSLGRGPSPAAAGSSWLQRFRRTRWPAPLEQQHIRPLAHGALLQAGYITTPARRWERSLRPGPQGLSCDDAGGIAAFALAHCVPERDEQLYLWSTRPGLRAIAWAESDTLIVAGTRPRLVHAVARGFAPASFDLAYLHAAICGWSLGDLTPYAGTRLIAVDTLLHVRAGACEQRAHPTPNTERSPRKPALQTRLYVDALREAVAPLAQLPGFELRLSGGKDSRLVAAVLHDRGIVPSTVACHGSPDGAEPRVAAELAQQLGWSIRFDVPVMAERGSLREGVRANLRLADGFFATEPRHAALGLHKLSNDPGPGIVLGHIELQKGGWARKLDEPLEQVLRNCKHRVTPLRDYVIPELNAARHSEVDAYVSGLNTADSAELGYWINYRFRVCRWLTSHYLAHSNELLPVYPLVDEKVVRVVHSAPLGQLVSERLLYRATCEAAPQLASLPLAQGHYRFEHTQPRSLTPLPERAVRAGSVRSGLDYDSALKEAGAYVRSSKLCGELRSLSSARGWSVIEDPRLAHGSMSPDASRLSAYLWTCYQASVLFDEGLD
jgi:hypothetical protein